MKVKDLIEMLSKLNPDAEIILDPTEGMKLRESILLFQEKYKNYSDKNLKYV